MTEELDELARTAADALVSALVTDSWQTVKRRFAAVIGHEQRMDRTRSELVATGAADRDEAQQAQVRTWSTRLKDVVEDKPETADALRALLAELGAALPREGPPPSQRARADHGSQAVVIGGGVSGTTGEVYIGVGKVDKRRIRFFFVPVDYVFRVMRKMITAHPIAATVTAAAVIGAASAGVALSSSPGGSPMADLTGTWQGTYTCPLGQGLTGVQIEVGAERSGAAPVVLSTYPVPSNPAVPRGSASFRGTLANGTVSLSPVAWKVRPQGWTLNEWTGALPPVGSDTFSGTVIGCSTFEMHRASAGPVPSAAAGSWQGTYVCSQGITGLRLDVQASSGGALRATFNFYPVPANSSVPSGSYAMTGFVDPAGVFLYQDHWISQPSGWVMEDVATGLPQDGSTTLAGSVVGCSPLSLKKTS
jgi:hypothetical protein